MLGPDSDWEAAEKEKGFLRMWPAGSLQETGDKTREVIEDLRTKGTLQMPA